ncbi:chromosome transmission fidelity protein 8 homolog [Phlebotomus papatasi]|uniref:chromosome transmission fidelity protein 8 homolog n=1 Tax=Phlebotomus papatasi TaxID=29031 RepID=UPI002483326A|nr:chromosome transmission fidelity protein 8 homolog [Phlebotomus papatasi]
MPILIKTGEHSNGTPEWGFIELQGDLEVRGEQSMDKQFIGDLYYTKYGQPILIIGHHILHGREVTMEKPYAVLEKIVKPTEKSPEDENMEVDVNQSISDSQILDSTVAIEHKSRQKTEYLVKAIVKKKLIFRARPKPIIANVTKK